MAARSPVCIYFLSLHCNVNSETKTSLVTTHDWAIGIAIAPIRLNLGQIFDFPDCYISGEFYSVQPLSI